MIQDFINKQFFTLFIFTLIFGLLLYGTIGFDFIDEICATLLFILFGYSLFKSPEWLMNKAFLTTIGVFLFIYAIPFVSIVTLKLLLSQILLFNSNHT